jgi:hypothetical protein
MADEPTAEDRAVARRVRRHLQDDADDPVPKLPRGRGFKLPRAHLFKIAATTAILVLIIVFQRSCAESVSQFVTSFDNGSQRVPTPTSVDEDLGSGSQHFEVLGPDLDEKETRARIEREMERAKAERERREGSADPPPSHP